MPHICIRNLTVTYGDHPVLKDISVDIPDGQITAVIGPSGCGKTTLLKSLNRLIDLNEEARVRGSILIDGEDILQPSADVLSLRKKVGFLLQRPYSLPMSIYDNVAFGPRIHRVKDDQIMPRIESLVRRGIIQGWSPDDIGRQTRPGKAGPLDLLVESYLRLAGLWDEVKTRLREPAACLSVGQQQRLALARSLAVEPEVVLADEATSALDPISTQLIERQLKLLKTHYSIVMVTHILRQARRVADYVLFLYLGELIEHGPAAQVFESPREKYTQAYVHGEIS